MSKLTYQVSKVPLKFLIITFVAIVLHIGCQPDGGTPNPPSLTTSNFEGKEPKVEVSVGGKTWEIDPKRSYQATGVWINPNPRPLTDAERAQLTTVEAQAETLSGQLEQLRDEMNYLLRIEKPRIKVRYSFGMPPHRSTEPVIDFGEFPMEMERLTPTPKGP